MFCMSPLSAYPPGRILPLSGRFRCDTSSCSLSKSFFVGIFIWRGAIRYSFLREAPHLIDWHRESQSERFRQHAPRAKEHLCSDIGYVAVIKLALSTIEFRKIVLVEPQVLGSARVRGGTPPYRPRCIFFRSSKPVAV